MAGVLFVAAFVSTLLVALDATVFHHPPLPIRLLAAGLTCAGVAIAGRITVHGFTLGVGAARVHRDILRHATRRTIAGVDVLVVGDLTPRAFCVGFLRPTVVLSRGALMTLNARELAAVVAHENHHARRRDPARTIVVGALVMGFGRRRAASSVAEYYVTGRELAADRAAIRGPGPEALAGALLRADSWSGGAVHATRVDRLLGASCPRQISRIDGLSIAGATCTLVGTTVLMALSTGCPTGSDDCAGHARPALVTLLGLLAAIVVRGSGGRNSTPASPM